MQLLQGTAVAKRICREAEEQLSRLHRSGGHVCVCALAIAAPEAAEAYLQSQKRRFTAAGIEFKTVKLPPESTQEAVVEEISKLNRDPSVTGIVLALPVPGHLSARALQRAIAPEKDLEGVHPCNLGAVVAGERGLGPATAEAVMELLSSTGTPLQGKEAVVVGHSDIVGKPIALHLLEQLATVTVCHIGTTDLAFHTKRAEILVVAAGKPGLITEEMVRQGAIVIDVGINRVSTAEGKAKVVGDVDFPSVAPKCSWITPVPGGVGPVTVAVLIRRAVEAAAGRGHE